MKMLLSPAKTFVAVEAKEHKHLLTLPRFKDETAKLVRTLQTFKPAKLKQMMHISEALATLNYQRYQNWSFSTRSPVLAPAVFVFRGDVYRGLKVEELTTTEIKRLKRSLIILSGLYGLLRPFDGIQHYRLEMGTAFQTTQWSNLYDFWKDRPATELKTVLKPNEPIINLASSEYFQVLKPYVKDLNIITPCFKDNVRGTYKVVNSKAKYARGLMVSFIVKYNLRLPSKLSTFNREGYRYVKANSTPTAPVFIRD